MFQEVSAVIIAVKKKQKQNIKKTKKYIRNSQNNKIHEKLNDMEILGVDYC